MKLTTNQIEAMHHYSQYVGETVDVLCGYLTRNMNQDFAAKAVGPVVGMSTLRGLEKKGFIRIEDAFWKGATITVLKAVEA